MDYIKPTTITEPVMRDEMIDTDDLLARLLVVMPVYWFNMFVCSLEKIASETGYGRAEVEMKHKRIVQVNETTKRR